MKDVKIAKNELLKIIRENHAIHKKDVDDAITGYRMEVTEKLEEALAQAKEGTKFVTNLNLIEPISHVKDYEKIIRMLELSVDDEIVLNNQEFTMYVLDEWAWKEQARFINSSYSSKLG